MKHDNRYIWFDLMRGLAALMVSVYHLRNAVMVEFSMIPAPTLTDKVFYFLSGLGHQAVMVFFVLSGFFVGGSVLRNQYQFSWWSYLVSRLSRLWIVLIPALLLTYLVDTYLASIYPEVLAGSFESVWHSGPIAGQYSESLLTLLGNVFVVQKVFTPVFGTNGPLWSLANEFWYYLLFPLSWKAIVGFLPAKGNASRVLAIGLMALILFFYANGHALRLVDLVVWGRGLLGVSKRFCDASAWAAFERCTLCCGASPWQITWWAIIRFIGRYFFLSGLYWCG